MGNLQVPVVGAGLVQVLPVPQSVAVLQVNAEQAPDLAPPQVAPLMPVQSEAAKQLSVGWVHVPLMGAGLEQVLPVPQSVAVLQLVAEQAPDTTPPQVALALMPVQSEFARQLVAGNLQLPAIEAGLEQVLPVPQSVLVLHVAVEQAPLTSPVQLNLELILVQSDAVQQLAALGVQLPAVEPVQVPTPQLAAVVQLSAEQVPCVAPLHVEKDDTWLQSDF